MSLKNFHIFFIMISEVVTLGFGLWCFLSEAGKAMAGSAFWGTISLIAAVALVIYAIKFLQKVDREGIK